ncbi:COX8 domain-containing protein [Brienomyrus brachyistius]|uniref:COX8 domain-containing protein n=1 Tax=Brienomyrus brachyistius TaxID=42636 RepID=UPI0020B26FAA|nr:COX8 domain-containing protein [Brienomyrus brachyistius]XP_048829836.1 COX8 domain-containing protein [Brienomyrus brachyistius]
MPPVLRGVMRTRKSQGWARVLLWDQRSSLHSKPPKEPIGPGKTCFALSVFGAALLAPAGWIVYHIPEYRKRPHRPPK